jgi:DNA-binding HxlR family transcriptional regulator
MVDNKFQNERKKDIMAIHDAMDALSGKWKVSIIATLCFYTQRRFTDIQTDLNSISNKMLSKELKDLEINKLVKRIVLDTSPVSVRYELTNYGRSLETVVKTLISWGAEHRKQTMGK